jgi:hypothetical protein
MAPDAGHGFVHQRAVGVGRRDLPAAAGAAPLGAQEHLVVGLVPDRVRDRAVAVAARDGLGEGAELPRVDSVALAVGLRRRPGHGPPGSPEGDVDHHAESGGARLADRAVEL